MLLMVKAGAKNFFCLGGHDNPLKRLIPDKESKRIKALSLEIFGPGLAWLGWALINFASAWIYNNDDATDKAAAFPMAILD
jgi:hypothetical protein